jgi:hypothetical protein
MSRIAGRAIVPLCAIACMVWVSSCALGRADARYITRPISKSGVLLLPELQGGYAGWCMATIVERTLRGSAGCGGPEVSTGPILTQACQENRARLDVFVLTTGNVRAVSADGGPGIPTRTNRTLGGELRTGAIEVVRRKGQPSGCGIKVTPLSANGVAIYGQGKRHIRFEFMLSSTLHWLGPERPSRGACGLTIRGVLPGVVAYSGDVTTKIKPLHGLFGHALLSCVDTIYTYQEEHRIRSAVLLNAEDPGARPPLLPAMSPLVGHPGLFEAPGANGKMVARRMPGAWLVVEAQDNIGLRVPIELLKDLRAEVHL